MAEENKKIVMFDFDGVLVDTLNICFSIMSEVNEYTNIEEYKTYFEGNIFEATRPDGSIRNPHPNFHERFLEHSRKLKIPPILKETLINLSKNYKLFIISSTPNKTLSHILEIEGVKEYFTEILGSDTHKSKVIKNQMVLEKYNVKPQNAVFITDTLGDIKEAKKCDIKSIAVTWGFHQRTTLEKGNPSMIIDDPAELLETIENVLK